MSFEEIIRMMENAEDYIDLYDAAAYIVDDDLRVDVEQLIGQCEDDGDSVEEAYSIVTSDLLDTKVYDLNESKQIDTEKERNSLQDYVDDINDVSNDKDLVNIIDDMENNKNINKDLVIAVRQLFKNNRFMPLNKKADTIIKFIKDNSDEPVKEQVEKPETLTEALEEDTEEIEDADIDTLDNNEKENKDIDEIKNKDDKDNSDIELTTLDTLKKRIGQQFDVGELNSLIQTTFNQYNQIFLMTSDLYNMNLDQTQTIEVDDDDTVYTISYDIIDMDSGLIELKDVEEKGV